jgi:hypothetical protein
MNKKDNSQRFVFPNGGYQDFPNECSAECVVVLKVEVPEGYDYNAEGVLAEVPVDLTLAAANLLASLRKSLGDHIDAEAIKLGYDSILSAASYADEPADLKNQVYGIALREWRSACYLVTRGAEATLTLETTWEDLKVLLPDFVTPEV